MNEPNKGRIYAFVLLLGVQFGTKQCFFLCLRIHGFDFWNKLVTIESKIQIGVRE